jgi:hypothetical protein
MTGTCSVPGCVVRHGPPPPSLTASGGWCAPATGIYGLRSAPGVLPPAATLSPAICSNRSTTGPHSAASDIRISWPACTALRIDTEDRP